MARSKKLEPVVGELDVVEREKLQTDLLYLGRKIGYTKLTDDLHGSIANDIASIEKNHDKTLVVLMPRGHFKSSFITITWTIQQILNNQNIAIWILTASDDLQKKFMREIQLKLLSLSTIFPDIIWSDANNAPLWNSSALTVKRTDTSGDATVEVDTILGTWTGKHKDVIIFDDVQDQKNSSTQSKIKEVIERWKNTVSVLNPTGKQVIIGTRWKKEDFYNKIINELGYRTILRSATENSKGEPCRLDDPDAHLILPEEFSFQILQNIKRKQGAYFYSLQYENNVLPDEVALFTMPDDPDHNWYRDTPPNIAKYMIIIDPAIAQGKNSDENVMQTIAIPAEGDVHVVKSLGKKTKVKQIVEDLFNEYARLKQLEATLIATNKKKQEASIVIGIETGSYQIALKQWVEEEMRRQNIYFSITELRNKGRNKYARISGLQPLFENRGITFSRQGCEALISQLLDFGSSEHDDHVDALAYMLDLLVLSYNVDIQSIEPDSPYGDPLSLESVLLKNEMDAEHSWNEY